MKKNQKPKRKIKIFRISNIIGLIAICYFVNTLAEQQVTLNKYNSQIETYEMQIEAKKKDLELYVVDEVTETTDEYIEKVARESLGLVKSYETIYVDISK